MAYIAKPQDLNKSKILTQESNRAINLGDISSEIDLTQLPLGDDKYTDSPKMGYVYSCQSSYRGGGAFEQGPWIDAKNGTWDLTKKIQVDGDVSWPEAEWKVSKNNTSRVLVGNDLPINHTTGTYPISSSDDAYQYDRNPNSISANDILLEVPLSPTLSDTPVCVGGEVGVMLSGVLMFNAFDAGGRDAVATEIQDHCQGHPQQSGFYHYHGWSDCLDEESNEDEHSELVGYAFDGFGIYGLKGEDGLELTSQDLDECHGHTHTINWDGKEREMFHYHMTQDFPYSVALLQRRSISQSSLVRRRPTRSTLIQTSTLWLSTATEKIDPPPLFITMRDLYGILNR